MDDQPLQLTRATSEELLKELQRRMTPVSGSEANPVVVASASVSASASASLATATELQSFDSSISSSMWGTVNEQVTQAIRWEAMQASMSRAVSWVSENSSSVVEASEEMPSPIHHASTAQLTTPASSPERPAQEKGEACTRGVKRNLAEAFSDGEEEEEARRPSSSLVAQIIQNGAWQASGIVGRTDNFYIGEKDTIKFPEYTVYIAKCPRNERNKNIGQNFKFVWGNGDVSTGLIVEKRRDGSWKVRWEDGSISQNLNPLLCQPCFSPQPIFTGFMMEMGGGRIDPFYANLNTWVTVSRYGSDEHFGSFPLFMFV